MLPSLGENHRAEPNRWLRSPLFHTPIFCFQSNRWLRFFKPCRFYLTSPLSARLFQSSISRGFTIHYSPFTIRNRWLRSSLFHRPIVCFQSNRWLRFSNLVGSTSFLALRNGSSGSRDRRRTQADKRDFSLRFAPFRMTTWFQSENSPFTLYPSNGFVLGSVPGHDPLFSISQWLRS